MELIAKTYLYNQHCPLAELTFQQHLSSRGNVAMLYIVLIRL